MSWKEIKGGAEKLALNANINSGVTSFVSSTTPSANWPTGVRSFVIVMGRGGATEEKMLCSARAGSNYTVATRGYDGTAAVAHVAGEAIEHCIDADTVSEANNHVNDTTLDNHTQYINVTRHDITARHVFGAAFATPGTPPAVAAAGSAGAAAGPARSDHTHTIGGNIVTYAMLQQVSASPRLLGRFTAGAGNAEEVSLGSSLVQSGTILQRAALTGDVTAAADGNALTLGAVVNSAKMASGFLVTTQGAAHPGSPTVGQLDFDSTAKLLYVYNGTVWVCITPQAAAVLTTQTTTSTSYTDLATSGPAVTVTTGTAAIVHLSCELGNNTVNGSIRMAVAVSGATTLAAADANSVYLLDTTGFGGAQGVTVYLTGLTAGANTFTAKYKQGGGTGNFSNRRIAVIALP